MPPQFAARAVSLGLALVALTASVAARAQEKPVPPALPTLPALPLAPERPVAAPRPPRERPIENLSPEQREKMRVANEQLRQEQTPLYEKLRATRRELDQAAQADPVDEKLIREKAAALGAIEGDLAVLRAKHRQSLKGVLPAAAPAFQPSAPVPGPKLNLRRSSSDAAATRFPPGQTPPSPAPPPAPAP